MILDHIKANPYNAPLEELLEKFYTAGCLNFLYEHYLLPSQPNVNPVEKPKKSVVISELVALSHAPNRLQAFCQQMPMELQKALQTLVWVDCFSLLELEKQIGAEIVILSEKTLKTPVFGSPPYDSTLQPEIFELLVVNNLKNWSTYRLSKQTAEVQLPPALRAFLKPGFPPPVHFNLIGLENWSEEGDSARFYNGSGTLVDDLRGLGDTFRRSTPKRNQDGSLSKSSLKELRKVMKGEELFPLSQYHSEELSNTRLHLLLEFFNRKGTPLLPPEDLSHDSLKKFLLDVARELTVSEPFVLEKLLPHIRSELSWETPEFFKKPFSKLLGLFASLPEGQWVSTKNLRNFRQYRDLDFIFFDVDSYTARRVYEATESSYYRQDRTRITRKNVDALLFAPLIHGMAFLLAALGFLEICYDAPEKHNRWRLEKQNFLTPFDGLKAVRLTPVGHFAFGLSKKLALTVAEQPKCQLHLYPDRLLARATLLDPITEKVLSEFMEELEPGFYQLERKRFLMGCSSPEKIQARVEDFKRRLPAELPPFWQNYLNGLRNEGLALQGLGEYGIYLLSDSPELARLFSTDQELRSSCLRVENRRVAIRKIDFPGVRKRLLKAGFFV